MKATRNPDKTVSVSFDLNDIMAIASTMLGSHPKLLCGVVAGISVADHERAISLMWPAVDAKRKQSPLLEQLIPSKEDWIESYTTQVNEVTAHTTLNPTVQRNDDGGFDVTLSMLEVAALADHAQNWIETGRVDKEVGLPILRPWSLLMLKSYTDQEIIDFLLEDGEYEDATQLVSEARAALTADRTKFEVPEPSIS